MLVLATKTVTETYEDRPADAAVPVSGVCKYVAHFTQSVEMRILGTDHGLQSADLLIQVYEGETVLRSMTATIAIESETGDVMISLLVPMSGRVVIIG